MASQCTQESVAGGVDVRAHVAQMQAKRCSRTGTRDSSSGVKVSVTHQQGEEDVWQVMAQAFGPPHSGHREGSTGVVKLFIQREPASIFIERSNRW